MEKFTVRDSLWAKELCDSCSQALGSSTSGEGFCRVCIEKHADKIDEALDDKKAVRVRFSYRRSRY